MSKYDKASLVMIPSAYKAEKLYSVLPENGNGDFTHDRNAGTATRVNKDGLIETVAADVPRLDYPLIDGVVQDCPSLLLEPARTNLITKSEDFLEWNDQSTITVTSDNAVSPDGTQNADKLTAGNEGAAKRILFTTVSSTVYTVSIFLKNIDSVQSRIEIYGSPSANIEIDWDSYTPSTKSSSTFTDIAYSSYGDNWWRVTAKFTATGTSNNFYVYPDRVDASNSIYTWGAQIEAGSYPTSYIPTSGSVVTRNADVCNSAGTSAEFNDSEGVLYLQTSMLSSNPDNSTFQIDDGTSTNSVRIRFTTTTNQINGLLFSNVSGQPNIDYTANDVTNQNKVAIRYQVGQIDLFFNGFEVGTITGNATPTGFNNLSLGTEGIVKEVIAFNEALSDTELEALTSYDSFTEMATEQLYTIE